MGNPYHKRKKLKGLKISISALVVSAICLSITYFLNYKLALIFFLALTILSIIAFLKYVLDLGMIY